MGASDRPAPEFASFGSWDELLTYARSLHSGALYYQAPLDVRPVQIGYKLYKNGKIKVYPPVSGGADPFTADSGHLDRFRFRRLAPEVEV